MFENVPFFEQILKILNFVLIPKLRTIFRKQVTRKNNGNKCKIPIKHKK
jgi:hypothetical protein